MVYDNVEENIDMLIIYLNDHSIKCIYLFVCLHGRKLRKMLLVVQMKLKFSKFKCIVTDMDLCEKNI